MSVGGFILELFEQVFGTKFRKGIAKMNASALNLTKGIFRLVVIIAVLFAAISFFSTPSAQASNEKADVTYTYVTVAPGQTLWAIAEKYAPERDTRDTIDAIVSLNNLTEVTVQPGQRIALPKN
jgi:LysM repeat protein